MAIALSIMNTNQWDQVMAGSGRAKIVTVSDPGGSGTIVYEWVDYPYLYLPYGVSRSDVHTVEFY